ncbi:endonuclease/exonuclease/phosphatase family protein [Algoriphagus sp. A40]|uniref:endonuclease/exonuclease/phosphatase family protein n=1 Tax=Algoriphagus sp. A40 TaxID=1945863 RepID=UPI000986D0BC|nr:endonuclease/exonuclease/phosphatase family protein [Algoriphagus sp. A40]OOG77842.1 endonuclease/exonuclease/phosphatase [Algoriphagus sp. A40]
MLPLKLLTLFFILATFLPLIKLDHWWIRIFDYPRFQKLVVLSVLLVFWLILGRDDTWFVAWLGSILVSLIYLGYLIKPYSIFGKKMIDRVRYDPNKGIHLIVGNVYQFNRKFEKALRLIRKKDPDLVFLVETDQAWANGLEPLNKSYPHRILVPLENTYGLVLYSKFPILRQEIQYLIDKEIPSLEIDLKLRNGRIITVYAIHPTPPVPGENMSSTDRDAEILIVAQKSKANPLPSLVIGDLNDVAWSHTTSLFLKISEMADPRRGRGFFSTFHANIPFFRWPLDHVFLSKDFGLSRIRVLPGFGSDHFPIELMAILTREDTTDTETASNEEEIEARAKIIKGHSNQKADQN